MAGRFRLVRELGAGAMGVVHEAIDATLDRPVALKVLRPSLARDPHQLARLEREARAVARLAHPNVVGVTELVHDEELGPLLVMELLAGVSLAERLASGPLDEAEAVSVLMQALDGLAAAHAAGMVHRDLKPSNLFLVPIATGVLVKVLDFGIVKLAEQGRLPKLTRQGALIGTPAYMSPEQIACEPVDARSDVYSMGACLYEALVGRPPYTGSHPLEVIAAVNEGPPPDLREIDRDVSPDLAHIARVAMSRDPSGRYQSAEAMREALRGAVTDRPPRDVGERARERRPSAAVTTFALPLERRWRPATAIALLVLGVALAIGAWVSDAPDHEPPVRPAPEPPSPPAEPPIAPEPVPLGVDPPELPSAPAPEPPPAHEERAAPRPRRPRRPEPATTAPPPGAQPPQTTRRVGEGILSPFGP